MVSNLKEVKARLYAKDEHAVEKPVSQGIKGKVSQSQSQEREDSIIYKSLLRKQGIQVIPINELFEDTPSGRLFEGIIEVMDDFYSSNLAQDVVRGMRENAMRGYFRAASRPMVIQ